MNSMRRSLAIIAGCLACCALPSRAESPPVTVKLEVVSPHSAKNAIAAKVPTDLSDIVIWLTPLDSEKKTASSPSAGRTAPQITQINKSFDPHVLVIQVGTPVQFPNRDPFLHNVFSLFNGKRFDLGFYEAGSSKTVHFDRVGVSYLFCNIHPEMSAAVVAVDSPYFGMSDRNGRVAIPNVPDGRYQLKVWYERSLPEDLKGASRTVVISESSRNLEPVRVVENPNFSLEHKNKYGQDYIPPANNTPVYNHP